MISKIVKNILGNKTDDKQTKQLKELYKQPLPERGLNVPSFQVFKSGIDQQADLLFLPHNYGYKYCLVVVDDHNKKCDAEPIKNKEAQTVLKAFKKIYARGILTIPANITVDSGSEFKSVFIQYCKDNDINRIQAPTNRHRMVSLVERKNQLLGSIIAQIQAHEELKTNKINRNWVKLLPDIITQINQNLPKPLTEAKYPDPIITASNKNIIPIGTKVLTKLEAPEDNITGKKQGKFRAGDIKWNRTPQIVNNIILKAGQPPLYQVGNEKFERTSQQLQLLK